MLLTFRSDIQPFITAYCGNSAFAQSNRNPQIPVIIEHIIWVLYTRYREYGRSVISIALTQNKDLYSQLTSITVFPNPADKIISINGIENTNLIVTNTAGMVIMTVNNYNGEYIDVSSLTPGCYFVIIDDVTVPFIKKQF